MANVAHSTLTGADLHEPKGVAAASSGQVYIADGGGSGAWTTPTTPTFMNKHIAGLTWSNAADAANDITILAGTCRDTSNTEDMTLSSSITKQVDAAWVVGSNQGGLDTGAVANTTYHIWLIKRVDTGVVDALFSTSASAPTMPTNYTKKRRIGSFVRTAGVNSAVTVVETSGGATEAFLTTLVTTSCASPAVTGTNFTITGLPSGVRFQTLVSVLSGQTSSTDERFIVVPPDVTVSSLAATLTATSMDGTIPAADSGADNIAYKVGGSMRIVSNTSAQLKIASSNAVLTYTTTLYGWQDFRRD